MNNELRNLYQEVIIDHSKKPRNFRKIMNATRTVEGFNPLCGDQLTLYVNIVDGVIEDVAFQGIGCAISKASASIMTTTIKNKKREDVLSLFEYAHTLLTKGPSDEMKLENAGKLEALSGVWEFPMRVKCATLAWHTLYSALETTGTQISTEYRDDHKA